MIQYSHDLFYIAPFYHLAFPNLDHLIATDLDIEFRYLDKGLFSSFTCFVQGQVWRSCTNNFNSFPNQTFWERHQTLP